MSKRKGWTAGAKVFQRETGRYYGDFRSYATEGGQKEPLILGGETFATKDYEAAQLIFAKRLQELMDARRDGVEGATKPLGKYVEHHLLWKEKGGKVSKQWIEQTRRLLGVVVDYLGKDRPLSSIKVSDIQDLVIFLEEETRTNKRGISRRRYSTGTIGHHLVSLGHLYKRALSEERATFNPVAAMMDKPSTTSGQKLADWFPVHEAALFLEACRTAEVPEGMYLRPLVATCLLTGGRAAEVFGLELKDVDRTAGLIRFRPNKWRGLKNKGSKRAVPIPPQLEEILTAHIETLPQGAELLFPFYRDGQEVIRTSGNYNPIYTALRAVEKSSGALRRSGDGAPAKKLRGLHTFRHTFATAMLQTVDDHGAPVAFFTVATLLGHKTTSMLEETYAHIDREKNRQPNLEYRVENHADLLGDRLKDLSLNLSLNPKSTPNGKDPAQAESLDRAASLV